MSFFDRPTPITGKNAYFAAANTHTGFRSYFPTLFAPYRRLIIKGGPGCGKSTLMKRFAAAAQARGLEAERYYCSSDTSSLDGVVIPSLSLAILDGTPPHALEPILPGVRDGILDLTAFWDADHLKADGDAIAALQKESACLYRQVYRLMEAICQLELAAEEKMADAFNEALAARIICRTLDKYKVTGEGGTMLCRPTSALGSQGYVAFDTHEKAAVLTVTVKDRGLFAHRFFTLMQQELVRRGVDFEITPRPLDLRIDSLYLPKAGLFFTARRQEETESSINLDRMLPSRGAGIRRESRRFLKTAEELLEETTLLLREVGRLHAKTESYYVAAMNFPALDAFGETLIKKELGDT